MAVKKVGDDPAAVRRATCKRCGSILEYVPLDVEAHTSTDYTGTPDTDYFIRCPECNERVYVKR